MACKECTHIKKKCAMMEETNNKERVRKQKRKVEMGRVRAWWVKDGEGREAK